MATLLVDSQAAPTSEQSPAGSPNGAEVEPSPTGTPDALLLSSAPADQTCARCGAPMSLAQDWCLQCGAGAPGAIGSPGWRSAATILLAT
ncbi:MAG: hypothetical protein H0X28_10935, partial [Solirubrobacterales bacterium]|nr:hypothetical protein [Solirubrobacterales bacterium]